jgi:hypothetical protein
MSAPTILRVIDNPQLFAPWFRKPATWSAWRVILAALFGLPIADDDLDLFRRCTGLLLNPLDKLIAVPGLLGDEMQDHQAKVAVGEEAAEASSASLPTMLTTAVVVFVLAVF